MAYTYNAIGNILTRIETIGATPSATYTYAYAGTSYANPHAVTSMQLKQLQQVQQLQHRTPTTTMET